MASIRLRLTTAYAAALIGTIATFAAALWVSRRAVSYEEREQYVSDQSVLATRIIQQAVEVGDSITVTRDSLVGPVLSSRLRTLLDAIPTYVLVLDPDGRLLYASPTALLLSADDRAALQAAVIASSPTGESGFVQLASDRLLVHARATPELGGPISRIATATSTRPAEVGPRELIGTMLLIAPVVLIFSIWGAYIIAGRAFEPVQRIMNEVEAITDGRSLHRRLPLTESGDEMERLTATLNAMIGRLEGSFGALRRFTADASHELKTPLTVLRADVERAMHARTSSTEQLVALEEALRETTRMADLVESLLTLARADEGRFDLHREPVMLEPLVREVFETAVILGEDAGLTVLLPVVEDARVLGDRTRLRQLFLNLVTNAIKYTPRGGRLEVSLSRREGVATVTVRDSGVGIAAADLPYLFERFDRADRARSRMAERGGFGLGLAISQWIVQAHGGTITVHSRLGRGSTFTVALPLAGEPALPASAQAPEGVAAEG